MMRKKNNSRLRGLKIRVGRASQKEARPTLL
jgi:hypothetical protein